MKTSKINIQIVGIFLLIILVLSGKMWLDYRKKINPTEEETENMQDTVGGTITIQSERLGEERTIIVKLPAEYNDSDEVYPVLYMLDAEMEPFFENAVSMVDSDSTLGIIPRMIVVGIHNVDRNRDTIPVSVDERPGSGGALNFLMFLDEELIPFVEESYRTTRPRVLYGASNAGLFTVYALLERPNSFDAYIASSPMIGWCPEYIHRLAEERFTEPLQDKFLYMIFGSKDYVKVTEYVPGFVDLMQGKAPEGLRWVSRQIDGEGHVPSASLDEGLRAFFS